MTTSGIAGGINIAADNIIFSIADVSVSDVFPFWIFIIFYCIATVLFIFPNVDRFWPFSQFTFFQGKGRLGGIVALGFVTLLFGPHYYATSSVLYADKAALREGKCQPISMIYQGEQEPQSIGFSKFPDNSLQFDNINYDPPGSIHGINLLSDIRENLTENEQYFVCAYDDVVLEIRQ